MTQCNWKSQKNNGFLFDAREFLVKHLLTVGSRGRTEVKLKIRNISTGNTSKWNCIFYFANFSHQYLCFSFHSVHLELQLFISS